MPHELCNGSDPTRTKDRASIHVTYLKTDVDEDDWDRAVMGFTAVQRHFRNGSFAHDYVNGSQQLAKAIAAVVRRHEAEILAEIGVFNAPQA